MTESIAPADTPDLLWRRVGAAIIDIAIVVVLAIVAGLVLGEVAGLVALVVLAYELAAWVWWQGRTGASPGKQMVGLRVVDATGQPCGTGKAAVRWVAWLVDGFPYCLPVVGFVMIFTNADQRRLGDRWAGTWVVLADAVGRPPTAHAETTDPEPEWDDDRQAYVRTDPASGRRQVFDESAGTWTALED
jgi:uncharacterized RDD family membrane protein YckC